MKELNLHIQVIVKQEDELTTQELALLDEARRATYRSYAPYSYFSVGAAVELANGTIISGSNQENAAYPSGLCAERTAVFYAGSQHPDQPIRRLCIAARDTEGNFLSRPISPCGACRQVLLARTRIRCQWRGAARSRTTCRSQYPGAPLRHRGNLSHSFHQRPPAPQLRRFLPHLTTP